MNILHSLIGQMFEDKVIVNAYELRAYVDGFVLRDGGKTIFHGELLKK